MPESPYPVALMGQTYPLARGPRVRLRMATPRDEASIEALVERSTPHVLRVDVARLVRFDPRERAVICATALLEAVETILGVGAIELDGASLELLVVDHNLTEGLAELLRCALVARVDALQRARAA